MKYLKASVAALMAVAILLLAWIAMIVAIAIGWPILKLRRCWLHSDADAPDTRWPTGY